jgi:hypothetical protein
MIADLRSQTNRFANTSNYFNTSHSSPLNVQLQSLRAFWTESIRSRPSDQRLGLITDEMINLIQHTNIPAQPLPTNLSHRVDLPKTPDACRQSAPVVSLQAIPKSVPCKRSTNSSPHNTRANTVCVVISPTAISGRNASVSSLESVCMGAASSSTVL